MPKKFPPQKKIFLIWVRKERRNMIENVDLRAVDTHRKLAELHVDMIRQDEPDATEVYLEERESNHLYAQRDMELILRWRKTTGESSG